MVAMRTLLAEHTKLTAEQKARAADLAAQCVAGPGRTSVALIGWLAVQANVCIDRAILVATDMEVARPRPQRQKSKPELDSSFVFRDARLTILLPWIPKWKNGDDPLHQVPFIESFFSSLEPTFSSPFNTRMKSSCVEKNDRYSFKENDA